jgi:carbon-monoxide dehydrogenase small subunit
MNICFVLNGEQVSVNTSPARRLLDVLREDFNLIGPKEGCGEGECGACSVLLDGRLVRACITPAGNVQGRDLMTIEGYSQTPQYRLIEEAFSTAGAVQCGFCTPGMVMAAEALLRANPSPTEAEIREAISGNLCRCTGYNMIVQAVQLAAKRGAGLWRK